MRAEPLTPLALSAADLATMLGVSVRQIWQWDANGGIGPAPVKLSERVTRWDRRECEAWWDACRAAGRRIGRREWQTMREGVTP